MTEVKFIRLCRVVRHDFDGIVTTPIIINISNIAHLSPDDNGTMIRLFTDDSPILVTEAFDEVLACFPEDYFLYG